MEGGRRHESLALRHILSVLRRRWGIVLLAVVIAAVGAGALSVVQQPVYESKAEVLLSYQNLAGSLTGTTDSTVTQSPERVAETQAQLARVPEVARNTLRAAGVRDMTVSEFLDASSVSPSSDNDLLTFRVSDEDPARAQILTTEYARQFIAYRLRLDTAAIERARQELRTRIDELREVGGDDSGLLASLIEKDQTLQTLRSLQTSNALLVREGDEAGKVSPKPVRNVLLGLGLGLLVGIGFAFLREALDTRVRSAEEIGERLDLPLLARLPEPPRALRGAGRLVMLDQPAGVHAEAFRMLRTNIEFVDAERRCQVVAVTSAVNDEGKSTTAANLAVAFARAGSRVVLIDLDLRRPTLNTFFGVGDRPGVTDIAIDGLPLHETLIPLSAMGSLAVGSDSLASPHGPRNGAPNRGGRLDLLPSGAPPKDVGELVGSPALASLLGALRTYCDLVIVDTPPLLRVGDTMAMSVNFDGMLVVARANLVSAPMLSEMARILRRLRAAKLGVVVTGAQTGDSYGGDYYGYGAEGSRAEGLSSPSRR
jgi:polysaccharide biosynthesis transport protein